MFPVSHLQQPSKAVARNNITTVTAYMICTHSLQQFSVQALPQIDMYLVTFSGFLSRQFVPSPLNFIKAFHTPTHLKDITSSYRRSASQVNQAHRKVKIGNT